MIYNNLSFPKLSNRPFFYINVVQKLDGKIQVKNDPRAYWPIGSQKDYETLIQLRTHADVLIHGKNTATWIRAIDKLGQDQFQAKRRELKKTRDILYVIISAHPEKDLIPFLENPPTGVKTMLFTTQNSHVPAKLSSITQIVRFGKNRVNPLAIAEYLQQSNYSSVLVEGGPALWSHFFQSNLIDEIFLTLAPKIFGSEVDNTLTLSEGALFAPNQIKEYNLISMKQFKNEVFLRYRKDK